MIEMSVPVFIFIIILIIALIVMSVTAGMALVYVSMYDDAKWDYRFNKFVSDKDDMED